MTHAANRRRATRRLIIITAVVLAVGLWHARGGVVVDRPLDTSALDDANAARRRAAVERATTVTGLVMTTESYDILGVRLELESRPDVFVTTFLPTRDVTRLDAGDVVTVRGRVRFHDDPELPTIVVGDDAAYPLILTPARLVSVDVPIESRAR